MVLQARRKLERNVGGLERLPLLRAMQKIPTVMPGENHAAPQCLDSTRFQGIPGDSYPPGETAALVSLQPHPALQELHPSGSARVWNVTEQPSGMRLAIVALWQCKAFFLKDAT